MSDSTTPFELATRVYAAAHQCNPSEVSGAEGGYEEVQRILLEERQRPVSGITEEMIERAAEGILNAQVVADTGQPLSARRYAKAALEAALSGVVVFQPLEPDGTWTDGVPYWNAETWTITAQVHDNGQPYTRVNGQVWLVTKTETVGVALLAAAGEARRLAEQAQQVCSCSPGIYTPGEQFAEPPTQDDACPVHGQGEERVGLATETGEPHAD